MNTTRTTGLAALSLLVLAACGGGGGGAPSPGPDGAPPPAGTSLGVVDVAVDAQGNAVSASFASAVGVNDANQVIGFAAIEPGAPFAAARWAVDATGAQAAAPARLAPLAGNSFSAAFAVDAAGSAFGVSEKGAVRVAVRWPAGAGEAIELPALAPSGSSAAYAATSDGALVVGEAQNASGFTRAVVWAADGQGGYGAALPLPVNIFSAPGMQAPFAAAHGVARVGAAIWVVGEAEDYQGVERAVLWRSTDGVSYTATDLHKNEVRTVANAVNGSGVVVGEAEVSSGAFVPSVWRLEDTGTELVRSALAATGAAVAVSEANRVAGWTGSGPTAAVWTLPGGAAVSPVTGGNGPSRAQDLNANGIVVGTQGSRGFVTLLP